MQKKCLRLNMLSAAVLMALGLSSSVASAKSVTVTGIIETKSPKVAFSKTKSVVEAFVEPTIITIKEGANSGCIMTSSEEVAISATNEDGLSCYVDFVPPYAMVKSAKNENKEWELTGILNKTGITTIPLTSTFFSGSAETPIDIDVSELSIEAIAPIPLNVVNVDYISNYNSGSGNTFEINTPEAANRISVTLSTEDKDYDRILSLTGYGECEIKSGTSTPCNISLENHSFGSQDDRHGQIVIPAVADSHNRYFTTNNLVPENNITIKWDSRLSSHFGTAYGDNPELNQLTLDNGDVIQAPDGKWVVVFKTPHHARQDDWWHLAGNAKLEPIEGSHKDVPELIIDGADYTYLWQSRETPSYSSIRPENIEYRDEYILMTFDTSGITSSHYTVEIDIADKLNNEFSIEAETAVENIDIEYLYFVNGREGGERVTPVYFPRDIQFAMFSRFRDLTIESVTINDIAAEYEDINDQGYHFRLTSLPESITSGTNVDFKVKVRDNFGILHEYVNNFIIQPFETELRYSEAYDQVQKYSVDLRQSNKESGTRECKLYDNAEDAKLSKFEYSSELHCYLEWLDLDPEMEVESIGRKYLVKGFSATSNPEYHYNVHFFDSKGNESISKTKTISLTSIDVPEIMLEIENGDIIEGDERRAFSTPVAGGKVAEIRARMINADGKIVADNPFGDAIVTNIRQSGQSTVIEPRSYIRVYTNPGKLWDVGTLTVKAGYNRTTDHDKTEEISMVYVPDENVTAFIDMEDTSIVNTSPYHLKIGIGVLDRGTDDFWYDKNTHGQWMVQLQRYDGNKIYTDVGSPEQLNDDGSFTFQIDPIELIGDETYRYRIVANIISEYDGYSREIISRYKNFKAHKGGPIEAVIAASYRVKTLPFNYRGTLKFDSNADKKAYGNIVWHYRNVKNNNWIEVPANYPERFEFTFTEPGTYETRATITNAFTNVVSEVISDSILAYEEVDAELSYNMVEYVNHPNVIKIESTDPDGVYDVEWSLDGCETFKQGEMEETFTRAEEGPLNVCARVAYKETEQAGKNRWLTLKKRISIIEPSPLKISVNTLRTSEVGFNSTIKATIQTATYINHELTANWFTPNGEEIPAILTKTGSNRYELVADYVIKQEDMEAYNQTLPFYISAVLKKVPETQSRQDASMAVLHYEFPQFEMRIDQDYLYSPTETDVFVKMLEEPEVDMAFKYEWLSRDGVQLVSSRNSRLGSRAKYHVTNPGVNEYALLISDERGNESLITSNSSTEEPQPATVTLTASYSNDAMRNPVDLMIRPKVKYEHREDKTIRAEYFVNGEKVLDAKNGTRLYYSVEKEGDYEILYKVYSELGAVNEQTLKFTVIPNEKPICEIKSTEGSSSYNFEAVCEDKDGKMVSYYMEFPELGLTANNRQYRLTKNATELVDKNSFTVRITGTDDSLESTTVEQLYHISKE